MPGNRSVMHVVGLMDEPQRIFPLSEVVPARLSERGFRRLLEAVSRSFVLKDGLPEELGRGLYGPSLFFRATGTFSLLNVCNHWTGRMLAAAGLPYWPVLATVPPGVLRAVPRQRAGHLALRAVPRQRAGHLAPGRLAPKAKA